MEQTAGTMQEEFDNTVANSEVDIKETDILNSGVLIIMSIAAWGGRKKINTDKIVDHTLAVDKGQINTSKSLLGQSNNALRVFSHIRGKATRYVTSPLRSIPFENEGVHFIPKGMAEDVDNQLKIYREEYMAEVDKFMEKYDDLKEQAAIKLSELYNPDDYPDNIRSKFRFEWRFFGITSDNMIGVLTPELYREAQEKHEQMLEEFKTEAVYNLHSTFALLVEKVSRQVTCYESRVSDSVFEQLDEFFKNFSKLNITSDKALEKSISDFKEVLHGMTPDSVRAMKKFDQTSQQRIGGAIKNIENQIRPLLADITQKRKRRIVA